MIAITAPAGNVGRTLTRLLVGSGTPARLLVRAGSPAGPTGGSLEAVAADLDDAASLDVGLRGVTRLFLLSPGPDTPAQDRAAIAAAQRNDVAHVVLLSSLGVEAGGIGGGTAHAPGEQVLKASGLNWTILRPNEFMTNTLAWLPEASAQGTLSLPTGDGRVAYIDPADIAAVAFAALTEAGHGGRTYRLSGPESLTAADLAQRFAEVLGRPVRHRDATVEEFRQAAGRMGMPAQVVDTLAEYYPAAAQSRMDIRSDDVAQVTGRPATPYLDFLRAAAGSKGRD